MRATPLAFLLLMPFSLMEMACAPLFCESEHCNDWQTEHSQTCRATLTIPEIEVKLRSTFSVDSTNDFFEKPSEEWEQNSINQFRDHVLICSSNVFDDWTVEKRKIASLSGAICRLNFPDKAKTQYEFWYDLDQKGAFWKVSDASGAEETVPLPLMTTQQEINGESRSFETGEKSLFFENVNFEVTHSRVSSDGYDATNDQDTGPRYSTSCKVGKFSIHIPNIHGSNEVRSRDAAILNDICTLQGTDALADYSVQIIPLDAGIQLRLLGGGDTVLQELYSSDCETTSDRY